ncbi:hypothetical protein [Streptomyces sp. WAC06614]|uniref:hypothetical protein n=1 Tax=Streptomyces sp. WAC06614 TaxID=2487416 RepID=UPI000F790D28|nr:hypothetical protein [Streptomyces sp. WAC06614]RSS82494.1 hypothetical protein EF918_06775 [Streptomyces sp. WAC06614]
MEQRIKGAAVLGAGADRAFFLGEDGEVSEFHRNIGNDAHWTYAGDGRQPWEKAFPEVHQQIPVRDRARMGLMFASGPGLLHWVHRSPCGEQHIVGRPGGPGTRTVHRPPWWPCDADRTVRGAAPLPDGSVLHATSTALHVHRADAGPRRLGPAPEGTTALCFDPTVGIVFCFTGPAAMSTFRLTGSGPATYALTPTGTGPVGAVWPDPGPGSP